MIMHNHFLCRNPFILPEIQNTEDELCPFLSIFYTEFYWLSQVERASLQGSKLGEMSSTVSELFPYLQEKNNILMTDSDKIDT